MIEILKEKVKDTLKKLYNLELPEKAKFEIPKNKSYGDLSTNVAFLLSKPLKKNPKFIAEEIKRELEKDDIFEKVQVVNNFINIRFSPKFYKYLFKKIEKPFFFLDSLKNHSLKAKKILYEYVSANPTGPLHLGHARGAIVGDVLTTISKKANFNVTREFYINDAGRQVKLLVASTLLRLFTLDKNLSWEDSIETLKENQIFLKHLKKLEISLEELKEEGYRGDYIRKIAKDYLNYASLNNLDINSLESFCLNWAMENIKKDLKDLGVEFDNYFSEKSLYENKDFENAFNLLKNLIYEKDGAIWLKTSLFGDDKDRVLRKSNGDWTYFAGDIAYHYSKLKRGYDYIVNIWGHDHHGYVKRLKIAVFLLDCLLNKKDPLEELKHIKDIDNYKKVDILLVQLVKLYRNGQEIKMSKRKGTFVTLKELLDEVGKDAIRFIFLTKSHETPLDFDIELAKSQVNDNPVFYVKYAHARICSILRKAKEQNLSWEESQLDPSLLNNLEKELIKKLYSAQNLILKVVEKKSPHLIPYYLLDLAADFHRYYNSYKILDKDINLSLNRLKIASLIKKVIKELLDILKVEAPEKM